MQSALSLSLSLSLLFLCTSLTTLPTHPHSSIRSQPLLPKKYMGIRADGHIYTRIQRSKAARSNFRAHPLPFLFLRHSLYFYKYKVLVALLDVGYQFWNKQMKSTRLYSHCLVYLLFF
ncbi:hypothetical protein BDF19DRAFT_80066 [Syncephalis fuscata]|nr:hypothetical protein BDF19DRAFT_80066 [Syncephalis fuscata]